MVLLACPIIAISDTCISLSPLDYWSVGHILAGVVNFVIAYLIFRFIYSDSTKTLFICLLICILTAIAWEIIEHTLVVWIGWKTKFDSPLNLTLDIVLWTFGSFGCLGMTYLMFVKTQDIFNTLREGETGDILNKINNTEERLDKNIILTYILYGVIVFILWFILFLVLGFITNLNL